MFCCPLKERTAAVCLMYMPPLGCEGWVFSKLPEIDYTIPICRVQADSRGKVMLPIVVVFFEHSACSEELNLDTTATATPQLSGGCPSLTAEVSIYIGILSVLSDTIKKACSLQVNILLVDFVGMFEYPEEHK